LFDPSEIERERGVIVEEIKRHEDNPWSKSYDEFTQTAFANNRYSRKVLGTVESLDTINQQVFQAYHRDQYIPENITLSTAGDVSFQEIQDEVSRLLEGYNHQAGNRIDLEKETWDVLDTNASVTMRRDVNQCYVLLGYPTQMITSVDEIMALSCLSTIAGEGRASRLYRRLHDDLGIVSSLGCSFIRLKYAGLFLVEAVTDLDKLDQVEEEIDKELWKLKDTVTEDELSRAKSIERADFAFGNEKAVSIAHIFGYGNAVTSIEEAVNYLEHFESVSIDDMMSTIDTYLIPQRRCKGLLIPNS
jgi:zinc protease